MVRVLNTIRRAVPVLGVFTLAAGGVACGSDVDDSGEPAPAEAADGSDPAPAESVDGSEPAPAETADASSEGSGERPQIVVTTNILGDVVSAAVGDQADVEVIMPLGSDPHDFAPSAQQAESMENADLLIVNGAGFEEGMLDIIANVSDSGTDVFSFAEQVDLLEFTDVHSDEEGEEHSDEEVVEAEEGVEAEEHSDEEGVEAEEHSDEEGDEHSDEEGDEHSDEAGGDPHIWTDPNRVATGVEALEPIVAGLAGVDADELSASFDEYVTELATLDSSMEDTLAAVPEAGRVMVTNHEVFGYLADRFDFEVVGAIIPSLTTNAEPSAADIEELSELIEAEGIPAIFGETTQSSTLADALADEVGGTVEVVELFSESLGEEGSGAETYVGMMELNAELIAGALTT